MKVKDDRTETEHDDELEGEGQDRGDAFAEHQFPGFQVAGAQPFPGAPTVFAEHRETEVADEESAEEHCRAGHHLFRTVDPGPVISDAHRGTERTFGEGHEAERHDREDHEEYRITSQDPEIVARHREDSSKA